VSKATRTATLKNAILSMHKTRNIRRQMMGKRKRGIYINEYKTNRRNEEIKVTGTEQSCSF
jgi:hypothetical protein